MKRFTQLLCFLSFALSIQAANAASDVGLAEVRDLGRLNGQALACGYADTAARIKSAMIQHAPKARQYGTAFEETTNQSFLTQSRQDQAACPDGPTLNGQVDEATQRLQAALPTTTPKQ
ncbi:MAG: hypothetical protein LLG15_00210 [Betaproteobacteria bacterium]|nr:hypothetical protein [Betaproteobacteria bacterium]